MDAAGLGLARLAQLSRHRPLTVADIESLDRSVGRVELLDGVLLVTPHADVDHPRWARRLANRLDELVPPGCEALDGVNVFEPGSDRVCVIPDVVVIQTDKIVQVPRQGEGVFPDGLELVIEITSSNRDVDLGVKRQRYQPGAFRIWWSTGPPTVRPSCLRAVARLGCLAPPPRVRTGMPSYKVTI